MAHIVREPFPQAVKTDSLKTTCQPLSCKCTVPYLRTLAGVKKKPESVLDCAPQRLFAHSHWVKCFLGLALSGSCRSREGLKYGNVLNGGSFSSLDAN